MMKLTKERMLEITNTIVNCTYCNEKNCSSCQFEWKKPTDMEMEMWMGRCLELFQADAEGLLHKFPCKLGDTVYKVIQQRDNFDDVPYEIVTAVCFNYNMIDKIGKTVFLTREEAEAALKKEGRSDRCLNRENGKS